MIGLRFDNTCTVSGKKTVSRVILRLYGLVYKTLRLSPLFLEHSVVVMTAGSVSRRSKIEFYGQPVFNFRFMKFVFRIGEGMKIWDQVADSDTGGPSSIIVRMECLFAFQFWYCELFVEKQLRGDRRHCFVLGGWWWGGAGGGMVEWGRKSYLGLAEIAYFSCRDFSQNNKHDTFCHVVSTGYLYVLFLWAIAFFY